MGRFARRSSVLAVVLAASGCGGGPAAPGDGGVMQDGGSEVRDAAGDAGLPVECGPGTIDVLPTCPSVAPCGGPLEGSFCFERLCIEERVLTGGSEMGPCSMVELRSHSGTVTGLLHLEAGAARLRSAADLRAEVFVPAACASMAGSCAAIADATTSGDLSAACTGDAATTGCTCVVTYVASADVTAPYTSSGSTLIVGEGPDRQTWHYCVEGTTLHATVEGADGVFYRFSRP